MCLELTLVIKDDSNISISSWMLTADWLLLSVTFFPPKAGLVWKFFPEGVQKSQTVLKPKAEGQSESFGLLKERISRLDPTWAGRMTF